MRDTQHGVFDDVLSQSLDFRIVLLRIGVFERFRDAFRFFLQDVGHGPAEDDQEGSNEGPDSKRLFKDEPAAEARVDDRRVAQGG